MDDESGKTGGSGVEPEEASGAGAGASGGGLPGNEADELTGALESTLESLNQSIEYMETIVRKLEAGDSDWEESVRMLAEANELAMESSQQLDRVVQDVIYGSQEDESGQEQDPFPGI